MTFVERPISLALLVFIVLVLVLPPAIRFLRARQAARHRGVVQDGPGGQR
jgi:TctA family transporter